MTASYAAMPVRRFPALPRRRAVSRSLAVVALAAIAMGGALVFAPGLSQAVLLLACPGVVLVLVLRGIPADDLDAQTLRIVLGLPSPIH